jgi:hypothetical protein
VEQNRRPGYESTQLATLSSTKVPKTYDEEKTDSSTNVAGRSGYQPAED